MDSEQISPVCPTCKRNYYRSAAPRWRNSSTSPRCTKMQTPPRSPWPKNRWKTCDAQQIGNPHPLAKSLATMRTDVQTELTTTKRSEYQTTRKKTNPDGTVNTVITAPHQQGKVHPVNAVDAEPRVTECTLGTIALREASYASYVEKRATTGAYAGADSKILEDTTTHAHNITRHHRPHTHPRHIRSHKKWFASTRSEIKDNDPILRR